MASPRRDLFADLERFVTAHGVRVRLRQMEIEKPGEFDGPCITINPEHDREACCFYLAHSFGSIHQWSTDAGRARKVFDDLRDTKQKAGMEFEQALEAWRLFEQTSSDHAVWALAEIGHGQVVEPYTVFFRADIEAMTLFHRTGKEPPWPEFFARWKDRVAKGEIPIEPFHPKPIRPFTPIRIEKQEVLQERD